MAAASAQVTDSEILEITVWGTLAVRQAEDSVVRQMEDLGYEARRSKGRLIFKPPRDWMGAAIFEDGLLRFRRPVAGYQAPPDALFEYDPRRQSGASDPAGRPLFEYEPGPSLWLFPSGRKLETVRSKVRTELEDEIRYYRAVVARTVLEENLVNLPDRLDALWNHGVPLGGGEVRVEGPAARRAVVLEYWASRPQTAEGLRASQTVEDWLFEVVQHSDTPVTKAEHDQYAAKRTDGRRLRGFEESP